MARYCLEDYYKHKCGHKYLSNVPPVLYHKILKNGIEAGLQVGETSDWDFSGYTDEAGPCYEESTSNICNVTGVSFHLETVTWLLAADSLVQKDQVRPSLFSWDNLYAMPRKENENKISTLFNTWILVEISYACYSINHFLKGDSKGS